jgi:hypothetical protein
VKVYSKLHSSKSSDCSTTMGDCRLLIALMGVVVFLVAAGTGVNGADFSPDCTNPILSLSPCLEFVAGLENAAAQPSKDCCLALANVLAHEPACLCLLFWSRDLLGFPIDLTLAVSLPAACNISASPETCKGTAFLGSFSCQSLKS